MSILRTIKYKYIFGLYVFLFIGHLFAILVKSNLFITCTKPLLILCLMAFFYLEYFLDSKNKLDSTIRQKKQKVTVLLALGFSWLGDVLLIFDGYNNLFFIFGLVSFLLAHVFYILFFLKKTHFEKVKWAMLLTPILYGVAIYILLLPSLGNLKFPVLVYTCVISIMLISVLHLPKIFRGSYYCILGAIVFVISDSILAIDKFRLSFYWAHFLIMLSYGFGQLLLVLGIVFNNKK